MNIFLIRKLVKFTCNKFNQILLVLVICQFVISSCDDEKQQNKYQSAFIGGEGYQPMVIESAGASSYVVAGRYDDRDGTTSEKLWIAKSNVSGQIIWSKTYLEGTLNAIKQINDGGFIAVGYAYGTDIGQGDYDFMIINVDSEGNMKWHKTIGSVETDKAYSIIQTSDGNYVVIGSTEFGNYGRSDCWIVKINSQGGLVWQYSYGGSDYETAYSIIETSDAGFMVAASSSSDNDGDVTGNFSNQDYWILKLDYSGQLVWQQSYGGFGYDQPNKIIEASDGGLVVAGSSSSEDGQIDDFRGISDAWVIKIDIEGDVVWKRSLGWAGYENAKDIIETSNGGYLVVGSSYMSHEEDTNHLGDTDYMIAKLDEAGVLEWVKLVGGSKSDNGLYCNELPDGNYMVGGTSNSTDNQVAGNISYSAWLVKIDSFGELLLK